MNSGLESERLLLKPMRREDAPFLLSLMNSPKWLQYIGDRGVRSIEDAEHYIETRVLPQEEKSGLTNYVVIRRTDDVKMGTCGYYDRQGIDGIEIGYAFLEAYEGKGYATEAAKLVYEAAFAIFGLSGLKAITTKDNLPSQRVLEKLGMKLSGTIDLGEETGLLLFESY